MNGHHLIMGELDDYLTGETLNDTHDERYRQQIARLLIDHKGHIKDEITPRFSLLVKAGDKQAIVKVDYVLTLLGKIRMIIKYAPGSLVTRHRPAVAASRIVAPYQIPFAVVTNGEDADILDAVTSSVVASGIEAIPSRSDLLQWTANSLYESIPNNRAEMESRIIYAFEVDGSCPCDDTICHLP